MLPYRPWQYYPRGQRLGQRYPLAQQLGPGKRCIERGYA